MIEPDPNEPAGQPFDQHTIVGAVICVLIACVVAYCAYSAIRYFALTLPTRIFVPKP